MSFISKSAFCSVGGRRTRHCWRQATGRTPEPRKMWPWRWKTYLARFVSWSR